MVPVSLSERFTTEEAGMVSLYLASTATNVRCSECGNTHWYVEELEMQDKAFKCSKCEVHIHRDILHIIRGYEDKDLIFEKVMDGGTLKIYKGEQPKLASVRITEEELTFPDHPIFPRGCHNLNGDKNKLDAGRVMAGVLEDFLPALHEVAKLGSMNNKPNGKYDRGSWMLVENADQRYNDAFWRHLVAGRHNVDPETGMPHDVAIAWNALVLLWFRLKREGKI